MTKPKPRAPAPKKRRGRALPPITGVAVGEPTQLTAFARLLLTYLRRPPLRLVVDTPDESEPEK